MAKRTCMETALAKLNYRMRTVRELERSLKELGYEESEIRETLEELKSFGYLDDRRYGIEFFRASRKKNWSSQRITRAMKEKGLESETIRSVMDELEDTDELERSGLTLDDRETALQEGLRMARVHLRSGKEIDEKFLNKVGRRLMTLGYNSGCCYYVMGRLKDNSDLSCEEEEY